MKMYLDLFHTNGCSVRIQFSERSAVDSENQLPNKRYVRRYKSKRTNSISLIFDPIISLVFSSPSNKYKTASIGFHIRKVTSIANTFKRIYTAINKYDVYVRDSSGKLVVDKRKAEKITETISTPYDSMQVIPTILTFDDSGESPGVALLCRDGICGILSLDDVVDFINTIITMDATTIMLLSSVVDEFQQVYHELSAVQKEIGDLRRINIQIYSLLQDVLKEVRKSTQSTESTIRWESVNKNN